jgi:hypothetical protein
MKTIRTISTLVAAAALLAVPATAVAVKGGQGKAQGKTKSCEKAHTVGYQVSGTLVSTTPDDPNLAGNQGTVTFTVTAANSHARNSGEIADQDAVKKGVQVVGATLTVPAAGDDFELKLNGFEEPDTPSAGDKVKVSGRIPVTKKRCAPEGTSTADRYGTPDVRRVTISDRDEDAVV